MARLLALFLSMPLMAMAAEHNQIGGNIFGQLMYLTLRAAYH